MKKKIPKKPQTTEELLARIDYRLGLRNTALRGFVMGMAQFFGATIGIAILFFFLSRMLHGIKSLPFIGDNQIVQIILQEVDKQTPSTTDVDIIVTPTLEDSNQ